MTAFERMVKAYTNLVRTNRMTLEQVPEKYREAVRGNL